MLTQLGHSCVRLMKSRLYESLFRNHFIVHLGLLNVSSSTNNCGCMIDGGNTIAAISVLLLMQWSTMEAEAIQFLQMEIW